MVTKKFRFAAIALLLVGCATHEQVPPTLSEETCDKPVCQVKITVTNGVIDVKPEILRIKGNNNVMIHWVLQTGTYKFNADGIEFYDPRHTSEFSDGQPTNNGQQFQWKDRNSGKNTSPWAYKVTVHPRAGGMPIVRDPVIVNDGL